MLEFVRVFQDEEALRQEDDNSNNLSWISPLIRTKKRILHCVQSKLDENLFLVVKDDGVGHLVFQQTRVSKPLKLCSARDAFKIRSVYFHPSLRFILILQSNGTIDVWNYTKVFRLLSSKNYGLKRAAASSGNEDFADGDDNGTVQGDDDNNNNTNNAGEDDTSSVAGSQQHQTSHKTNNKPSSVDVDGLMRQAVLSSPLDKNSYLQDNSSKLSLHFQPSAPNRSHNASNSNGDRLVVLCEERNVCWVFSSLTKQLLLSSSTGHASGLTAGSASALSTGSASALTVVAIEPSHVLQFPSQGVSDSAITTGASANMNNNNNMSPTDAVDTMHRLVDCCFVTDTPSLLLLFFTRNQQYSTVLSSQSNNTYKRNTGNKVFTRALDPLVLAVQLGCPTTSSNKSNSNNNNRGMAYLCGRQTLDLFSSAETTTVDASNSGNSCNATDSDSDSDDNNDSDSDDNDDNIKDNLCDRHTLYISDNGLQERGAAFGCLAGLRDRRTAALSLRPYVVYSHRGSGEGVSVTLAFRYLQQPLLLNHNTNNTNTNNSNALHQQRCFVTQWRVSVTWLQNIHVSSSNTSSITNVNSGNVSNVCRTVSHNSLCPATLLFGQIATHRDTHWVSVTNNNQNGNGSTTNVTNNNNAISVELRSETSERKDAAALQVLCVATHDPLFCNDINQGRREDNNDNTNVLDRGRVVVQDLSLPSNNSSNNNNNNNNNASNNGTSEIAVQSQTAVNVSVGSVLSVTDTRAVQLNTWLSLGVEDVACKQWLCYHLPHLLDTPSASSSTSSVVVGEEVQFLFGALRRLLNCSERGGAGNFNQNGASSTSTSPSPSGVMNRVVIISGNYTARKPLIAAEEAFSAVHTANHNANSDLSVTRSLPVTFLALSTNNANNNTPTSKPSNNNKSNKEMHNQSSSEAHSSYRVVATTFRDALLLHPSSANTTCIAACNTNSNLNTTTTSNNSNETVLHGGGLVALSHTGRRLKLLTPTSNSSNGTNSSSKKNNTADGTDDNGLDLLQNFDLIASTNTSTTATATDTNTGTNIGSNTTSLLREGEEGVRLFGEDCDCFAVLCRLNRIADNSNHDHGGSHTNHQRLVFLTLEPARGAVITTSNVVDNGTNATKKSSVNLISRGSVCLSREEKVLQVLAQPLSLCPSVTAHDNNKNNNVIDTANDKNKATIVSMGGEKDSMSVTEAAARRAHALLTHFSPTYCRNNSSNNGKNNNNNNNKNNNDNNNNNSNAVRLVVVRTDRRLLVVSTLPQHTPIVVYDSSTSSTDTLSGDCYTSSRGHWQWRACVGHMGDVQWIGDTLLLINSNDKSNNNSSSDNGNLSSSSRLYTLQLPNILNIIGNGSIKKHKKRKLLTLQQWKQRDIVSRGAGLCRGVSHTHNTQNSNSDSAVSRLLCSLATPNSSILVTAALCLDRIINVSYTSASTSSTNSSCVRLSQRPLSLLDTLTYHYLNTTSTSISSASSTDTSHGLRRDTVSLAVASQLVATHRTLAAAECATVSRDTLVLLYNKNSSHQNNSHHNSSQQSKNTAATDDSDNVYKEVSRRLAFSVLNLTNDSYYCSPNNNLSTTNGREEDGSVVTDTPRWLRGRWLSLLYLHHTNNVIGTNNDTDNTNNTAALKVLLQSLSRGQCTVATPILEVCLSRDLTQVSDHGYFGSNLHTMMVAPLSPLALTLSALSRLAIADVRRSHHRNTTGNKNNRSVVEDVTDTPLLVPWLRLLDAAGEDLAIFQTLRTLHGSNSGSHNDKSSRLEDVFLTELRQRVSVTPSAETARATLRYLSQANVHDDRHTVVTVPLQSVSVTLRGSRSLCDTLTHLLPHAADNHNNKSSKTAGSNNVHGYYWVRTHAIMTSTHRGGGSNAVTLSRSLLEEYLCLCHALETQLSNTTNSNNANHNTKNNSNNSANYSGTDNSGSSYFAEVSPHLKPVSWQDHVYSELHEDHLPVSVGDDNSNNNSMVVSSTSSNRQYLERVALYCRFSDAIYSTSNSNSFGNNNTSTSGGAESGFVFRSTSDPPALLNFLDLSRFESHLLELYLSSSPSNSAHSRESGCFSVAQSVSEVESNEKHESAKLLCDLQYNNSTADDRNVGEGGLRVSVQRGGALDLALYQSDISRSRLTVECHLALTVSAGLALATPTVNGISANKSLKLNENSTNGVSVTLMDRVCASSGLVLWRLVMRTDGRLSFQLYSGTNTNNSASNSINNDDNSYCYVEKVSKENVWSILQQPAPSNNNNNFDDDDALNMNNHDTDGINNNADGMTDGQVSWRFHHIALRLDGSSLHYLATTSTSNTTSSSEEVSDGVRLSVTEGELSVSVLVDGRDIALFAEHDEDDNNTGKKIKKAAIDNSHTNSSVVKRGRLCPGDIAETQLCVSHLRLLPLSKNADVCYRLTELRVWALWRDSVSLSQLRFSSLPLAEKRVRLTLQLKGTKRLFKPFQLITVPSSAAASTNNANDNHSGSIGSNSIHFNNTKSVISKSTNSSVSSGLLLPPSASTTSANKRLSVSAPNSANTSNSNNSSATNSVANVPPTDSTTSTTSTSTSTSTVVLSAREKRLLASRQSLAAGTTTNLPVATQAPSHTQTPVTPHSTTNAAIGATHNTAVVVREKEDSAISATNKNVEANGAGAGAVVAASTSAAVALKETASAAANNAAVNDSTATTTTTLTSTTTITTTASHNNSTSNDSIPTSNSRSNNSNTSSVTPPPPHWRSFPLHYTSAATLSVVQAKQLTTQILGSGAAFAMGSHTPALGSSVTDGHLVFSLLCDNTTDKNKEIVVWLANNTTGTNNNTDGKTAGNTTVLNDNNNASHSSSVSCLQTLKLALPSFSTSNTASEGEEEVSVATQITSNSSNNNNTANDKKVVCAVHRHTQKVLIVHEAAFASASATNAAEDFSAYSSSSSSSSLALSLREVVRIPLGKVPLVYFAFIAPELLLLVTANEAFTWRSTVINNNVPNNSGGSTNKVKNYHDPVKVLTRIDLQFYHKMNTSDSTTAAAAAAPVDKDLWRCRAVCHVCVSPSGVALADRWTCVATRASLCDTLEDTVEGEAEEGEDNKEDVEVAVSVEDGQEVEEGGGVFNGSKNVDIKKNTAKSMATSTAAAKISHSVSVNSRSKLLVSLHHFKSGVSVTLAAHSCVAAVFLNATHLLALHLVRNNNKNSNDKTNNTISNSKRCGYTAELAVYDLPQLLSLPDKDSKSVSVTLDQAFARTQQHSDNFNSISDVTRLFSGCVAVPHCVATPAQMFLVSRHTPSASVTVARVLIVQTLPATVRLCDLRYSNSNNTASNSTTSIGVEVRVVQEWSLSPALDHNDTDHTHDRNRNWHNTATADFAVVACHFNSSIKRLSVTIVPETLLQSVTDTLPETDVSHAVTLLQLQLQ